MSRINNITRETVEDIINKTNAKPENKINLVLQNCVVDENVFRYCEFIDNLTIKSNTTVLRDSFSGALIKNLIISDNNVTFVGYSFSSAQINNLTVKSNITIDEKGFSCVKIDNLTVENNATVKEDGFEYAQINNLTVKNDATIQNDGFYNTKITGSAKYSNGSNISQATLEAWGVKIN